MNAITEHTKNKQFNFYRNSAIRVKIFLFAVICLFSFNISVAQGNNREKGNKPDVSSVPQPRSPKIKPLQGYFWMVDEETGDSTICIVISPVTVYPPLKFKNKKQEQFYWRTVRDVKKTLPYAKMICETLVETYEYIETFPTQKEREKHLNDMEDEVYKQYKPVLMKFTKNQGKMLVKLIRRETDQSSYNLIKTFFGSFKAGFYQTFGRLFGVNLKGKYQPDKNDDDAIIERVCTMVEQGQL